MTDKQRFLEKLSAALTQRDISQTDIAPYIEQFDRFYDRMVLDSDASGGVLDDVESIADNIAAQVSDRYDEINRLAEKTMTVQAVKDDDEIPEIEGVEQLDADSEEFELVEIPSDIGTDENGESTEESEGTRLPDYVEKEQMQDSKMFWILFAASLPITLPLLFVGFGVFAAMWLALGAVIVGAIGALIGAVTIGTAAALIGIIYGITQLFISVPVGLYEIGIGIVVIGVVLFVGILLYNFAIRLAPIGFRLIYKLFKYALSKLEVLFNYLRRECAKL